MKRLRILALILTAAMLLSCMGTALAQGGDERSAASDIVIVIDQSKSMNSPDNREYRSDPEAYRLDAAQMIIGMCDMENSRVAIVPFYGSISNDKDVEFVSINEAQARLDKMEDVEDLRNKQLNANTDLGNALNYAVKLILERDDTTNAPMIIAITDGANELTKNNGKYSTRTAYVWDQATNTYSEVRVNEYGVDNDNTRQNRGQTSPINATTQQNNAVKAAQANGIPIYTVALKANTTRPDRLEEIRLFTAQLSTVADLTGGRYIELDSTNAHTLPTVFGEMFATQIGSSLLEQLTPVHVEGTQRTYRVNIPILNQSVLEANVYIPLSNIAPGSITLRDASGKDLSAGGQDVTYLPGGDRFVLYKIHSPRTLGNWVLQFDLKPGATSVQDISFNLLYNYDITLKTRVGGSFSSLQQPGVGVTVGKSDRLYITASFYETDDVTGQDVLSRDTHLYTRPVSGSGAANRIINRSSGTSMHTVNASDDSWQVIRATYNFVDETGTTVFSGELPSNGVNEFSLDLDLSTAYLSPEGFNQLRSGQYSLVVVADGAGLHRENSIPVTITNQAPEQVNAMSMRIVVSDPAQPETMAVQTLPIDLTQYVSDPDNDRLSYQFVADGSSAGILNVQVVTGADGTASAQFTTVMDPDGNMKFGQAPYTFTVRDYPDGETKTWTFNFDVISKSQQTLEEFTCTTTTQGIDMDGVAEKNSDVTFEMNLTNSAGLQDNTGAIRDFRGVVDIYDANNTSTKLGSVEMTLNSDGTKLVGAWRTGNESANLQAVCWYSFGQLRADPETITFKVLNHKPVQVDEAVEIFPTTLTYDPLPDFLSFIEQPTSVEARTIDMDTLFHDVDNEAYINYADPAVTDGSGSPVENIAIVRSDNVVELQPQQMGSAQIRFVAEDGDGERHEIIIKVMVVSIMWKWILIAAAVVLLIIIIHSIRMAARPRFAVGTMLSVRVNEALNPDQVCDIPHIQKQISLSYYIDHDAARRGGVSSDDLAQLFIKPMRGRSGSVQLTRVAKKNAIGALSVQMEGVELGKKSVVWKCESEIIIRHASDDTQCLRVTLSIADSYGSSAMTSTADSWNAETAPEFADFAPSAPQSSGSSQNEGGYEW